MLYVPQSRGTAQNQGVALRGVKGNTRPWRRLLGLRPPERVFLVAELATSGFPVEDPVDFDSITVHAAVPGATLTPQSFQIRDPSGAEALTSEQTDFDFRLIEPASVLGRVMHREAVPDLTAEL